MQSSNNSPELARLYFQSWQTFSISLLNRIFAKNAQYIILDKNRTLSGINEIEQYWKRNEARQKELNILYKVVVFSVNYYNICFTASFYDSEEEQRQTISGTIELFVEKDKIAELKERYTKKIV